MANSVDLSGGLSAVFNFLADCISRLIDFLSSVYLLPHVSALHLLVAIVILSMIISAVFVLFDGGIDDD